MLAFYLSTATSPKLYKTFPSQNREGKEASEGALCLEHLV